MVVEHYVNKFVQTDRWGDDNWWVVWVCPVEVHRDTLCNAVQQGVHALNREYLVQCAADAVDFVSQFEIDTSPNIQYCVRVADETGELVSLSASVELKAGRRPYAIVSIPSAPSHVVADHFAVAVEG